MLCGPSRPGYQWAQRRRIEVHPATGAAQLVESRETVQEVIVPKHVELETAVAPASRLFAGISEKVLLGYGVPPEWIPDVMQATEATVLEIAERLPAEAAEAILNLAVGIRPQGRQPMPAGGDSFAHPDAQRRFRVMNSLEELERALEYPWDRWWSAPVFCTTGFESLCF